MRPVDDDILLACVSSTQRPAGDSCFHPIYFARYAGSDESKVDKYQEEWARTLRIVLPQLSEEKIFDVTLCARECAVNAMKHGCGGSADQLSTFVILSNPETETLRLIICDPGPGHEFDLGAHKSKTRVSLIEDHRGLMLIEMLSSRFETRGKGAQVEMDFHFNSSPQAMAS